jgi:hypothetical protein
MIIIKERKLGGGFRVSLIHHQKKMKNLVGPDNQA